MFDSPVVHKHGVVVMQADVDTQRSHVSRLCGYRALPFWAALPGAGICVTSSRWSCRR